MGFSGLATHNKRLSNVDGRQHFPPSLYVCVPPPTKKANLSPSLEAEVRLPLALTHGM